MMLDALGMTRHGMVGAAPSSRGHSSCQRWPSLSSWLWLCRHSARSASGGRPSRTRGPASTGWLQRSGFRWSRFACWRARSFRWQQFDDAAIPTRVNANASSIPTPTSCDWRCEAGVSMIVPVPVGSPSASAVIGVALASAGRSGCVVVGVELRRSRRQSRAVRVGVGCSGRQRWQSTQQARHTRRACSSIPGIRVVGLQSAQGIGDDPTP